MARIRHSYPFQSSEDWASFLYQTPLSQPTVPHPTQFNPRDNYLAAIAEAEVYLAAQQLQEDALRRAWTVQIQRLKPKQHPQPAHAPTATAAALRFDAVRRRIQEECARS
jgi:hypothetical protein